MSANGGKLKYIRDYLPNQQTAREKDACREFAHDATRERVDPIIPSFRRRFLDESFFRTHFTSYSSGQAQLHEKTFAGKHCSCRNCSTKVASIFRKTKDWNSLVRKSSYVTFNRMWKGHYCTARVCACKGNFSRASLGRDNAWLGECLLKNLARRRVM